MRLLSLHLPTFPFYKFHNIVTLPTLSLPFNTKQKKILVNIILQIHYTQGLDLLFLIAECGFTTFTSKEKSPLPPPIYIYTWQGKEEITLGIQ